MLTQAEVSLRVTDRARAKILADIVASKHDSAIPALLLSLDPDNKKTSWTVALYDRRIAEGPDFVALLIRASGVELILPQLNLIDSLQGVELDWTDAGYSVTPS